MIVAMPKVVQAERVAAATGWRQLPGRSPGKLSPLLDAGDGFEAGRAAVEAVSALFKLYEPGPGWNGGTATLNRRTRQMDVRLFFFGGRCVSQIAEGGLAHKQLVERAPQAVNVGADIDPAAILPLLGCHVIGRAQRKVAVREV